MIYKIRGLDVILDFDLANLYEVETKKLNQAVKRNIKRFPNDFMFQLTFDEAHKILLEKINQQGGEASDSRSQNVTLEKGKNIKYLPHAFTEQGIAMLSSVLRSDKAIEMNIQIIRTFVQMRKIVISQNDKTVKLADLERVQKIHSHLLHDHHDSLAVLFEALRRLENFSEEEKRKIGFIR